MKMDVLFAGVPVSDFAAAKAWYTSLLGREEDIVAKDDEVMWRIAEGGWLYIVADPKRAGRSLVALSVPDLDAACAEIAQRGVHVDSMETVSDAARKANFVDPDGNLIAIIEVAQQDR